MEKFSTVLDRWGQDLGSLTLGIKALANEFPEYTHTADQALAMSGVAGRLQSQVQLCAMNCPPNILTKVSEEVFVDPECAFDEFKPYANPQNELPAEVQSAAAKLKRRVADYLRDNYEGEPGPFIGLFAWALDQSILRSIAEGDIEDSEDSTHVLLNDPAMALDQVVDYLALQFRDVFGFKQDEGILNGLQEELADQH